MLFDDLHNVREEEHSAFGKNWIGPNQINRSWTKVAHFPKEEGGDGQPVDIYLSALPARFTKLHALKSTNSIGEPYNEYFITTGSGSEVRDLIIELAKQIAEGMIGVSLIDE